MLKGNTANKKKQKKRITAESAHHFTGKHKNTNKYMHEYIYVYA